MSPRCISHRTLIKAARSNSTVGKSFICVAALMSGRYPVQRQRLPDNALSISCRDGGSVLPSCSRYRLHKDITKPGAQKPHCEPWQSTTACCTECNEPSACLRSSTVNSALPSSVDMNWMHALTVPSLSRSFCNSPITTVHAPQSPSAHPSLVPVQCKSSRTCCRIVWVGWVWLWVKVWTLPR